MNDEHQIHRGRQAHQDIEFPSGDMLTPKHYNYGPVVTQIYAPCKIFG